MIIITSGRGYLDIDAYASGIAYRELFKLRGIEAKFVSSSKLNGSITSTLLEIPFGIDDYKIKIEDKFIVLDVSNKEYFDIIVNFDDIIEIIDHHPGFEDYWKNRLGNNSTIEEIGSVATIIALKYDEYDLFDKMNKGVAKLLMAAILDNTLNFTANIACDKDKEMYKKLEKLVDEPKFDVLYFKECQKYIEDNLKTAIIDDLKCEYINDYLPKILGQLMVFDGSMLLYKINKIKNIMSNYEYDWLINIISLKDSKSYILCSNDVVEDNMNKLFDCEITKDYIILKSAKLRKEIIKCAKDKYISDNYYKAYEKRYEKVHSNGMLWGLVTLL